MQFLENMINLLKNEELNQTKIIILFEIGLRKDAKLTVSNISALTKCHVQTIYRAVRELTADGWVEGGRLTKKAVEHIGIDPHVYFPGPDIPPTPEYRGRGWWT